MNLVSSSCASTSDTPLHRPKRGSFHLRQSVRRCQDSATLPRSTSFKLIVAATCRCSSPRRWCWVSKVLTLSTVDQGLRVLVVAIGELLLLNAVRRGRLLVDAELWKTFDRLFCCSSDRVSGTPHDGLRAKRVQAEPASLILSRQQVRQKLKENQNGNAATRFHVMKPSKSRYSLSDSHRLGKVLVTATFRTRMIQHMVYSASVHASDSRLQLLPVGSIRPG